MPITIEKVLLLKQFSLFKEVSNVALSDLIALSEECHFPVGEVLIQAGEPNSYAYFIIAGQVTSTSTDNTTQISNKQVIGLDSVFWNASVTTTFKATQEVFALKVHQDKLYRMMSLHPSLAMAILNELSTFIHR